MPRLMTFLIVLIAFSVAPMTSTAYAAAKMRVETVVITTASVEYSFEAEIADTPQHKSQGLMQRPLMDADRGMLFDNGVEREMFMWMKNTILTLDMIFITKDGTVARIAKNTVPFSETIIPSGQPVKGVLEVIAGTADRIGLKPGDKVKHQMFAE